MFDIDNAHYIPAYGVSVSLLGYPYHRDQGKLGTSTVWEYNVWEDNEYFCLSNYDRRVIMFETHHDKIIHITTCLYEGNLNAWNAVLLAHETTKLPNVNFASVGIDGFRKQFTVEVVGYQNDDR